MADSTNEYAIDPTTGVAIAVDAPLQESDAPLMGNPVLMRRSVPRKGPNIALFGGIAAAAVILAGGAALFVAQSSHRSDLMTNAPSTPSAAQEQADATPAPMPSPIAAPVASTAAPVMADASTPETPVRPLRADRAEVRAVRHAEHRAAAQDAGQNGADTAATVTQSQVAPPPVTATMPAPTPAASPPPVTATTPAPSAPDTAPVITPPPAGQ